MVSSDSGRFTFSQLAKNCNRVVKAAFQLSKRFSDKKYIVLRKINHLYEFLGFSAKKANFWLVFSAGFSRQKSIYPEDFLKNRSAYLEGNKILDNFWIWARFFGGVTILFSRVMENAFYISI